MVEMIKIATTVMHVELTLQLYNFPIAVEPTFTKEPVDQTVSVGQVVSFECRVTGSPLPAIFWQKDGLQVMLIKQ